MAQLANEKVGFTTSDKNYRYDGKGSTDTLVGAESVNCLLSVLRMARKKLTVTLNLG